MPKRIKNLILKKLNYIKDVAEISGDDDAIESITKLSDEISLLINLYSPKRKK